MEYLFELGETARIGKPGSEKGDFDWFETHELRGVPFDLAKSERMIFSQIAFVDYGYFFDSDNTWYYVDPGPFSLKIPLEHIAEHLDENYYEFEYLKKVERRLVSYIFGEYLESNDDFRDYLNETVPPGRASLKTKVARIKKAILAEEHPIYEGLYENYERIFDYFDDWVVVVPAKRGVRFKLRKKSDGHVETINW